MTVPRLRHRISKKVISPSIYRQLHDSKLDKQAAKRIIARISTRDFDDSARTIVECFRLSKSVISHDFIAASSKALEEFQSRDLSSEPYVALFLDGKSFADELIILAMGVTKKGNKYIVEMTQAPEESSVVIEQMLNDLMDRWFSYEEGFFCVNDGSRSISIAIRNVLQDTAAQQRSRLHKIRNVVAHVTEKHRHDIRMKMWEANNTHNFEEAMQNLQQLAV